MDDIVAEDRDLMLDKLKKDFKIWLFVKMINIRSGALGAGGADGRKAASCCCDDGARGCWGRGGN